MSNYGNFLRRTAWTMIRDELRIAEENCRPDHVLIADACDTFWRSWRDTLRWVMKMLRERRLGRMR